MQSRRIWITGASQGIGFACAQHFSATGAALSLCARREAPLLEASAALAHQGAQQVIATSADVSDREAIARFASRSIEELGGCDVLIHNAGGGGPGGVLDRDEASFESDFNYAFNVNVMAAARLARHAAEPLTHAQGVIVLVSSAWRRRPDAAMPASYGASKAALDDLTRSLAREFGPRGVRVVGVAPGPIWTETWEADLKRQAQREGAELEDMRARITDDVGATTPLGRPGTMAEVARAIAWLSGPEASYITGTSVVIDGGFVVGT